jgi:[acyl-carrier-protein] S-malonyltransferase
VTKVAFMFPGQGSQEVGMGAAFAASSAAARAAFDRASAALGFDVAEVCFDGPLERLSSTEMTQPALTATSVACLAAVEEAGFKADYVIGHSVGEYAALVAAGSLSVEDAMVLVRERGLATAESARWRR